MDSELFGLDGKIAIVTGSTRGIGFAIVEQFCKSGASCVISSENAEDVAAATARCRDLGYQVTGMVCDVTDSESSANLVSETIRAFGGLDILVCNAGVTGKLGPILGEDREDYARVFDINLHSMVSLANLAYPHLKARGGGSIVLLSSIAALRGNAAINAYALAKAGVAQLARNLAVQWGPENIRSNSISPGLIRTGMSKSLPSTDDFMRRRLQMTPLRRTGEVEEIAGCAHFLVSAAGSFVNGHDLVVDGGTTITDGS